MQLTRDSHSRIKVSLRPTQQGGQTSGGQISQRIRGLEAADSRTLVQALQEASQDRSARHHVRHVSDGGGEMRCGQREVRHLTARMSGLPQRHRCVGYDAQKPAAAD